MKKMCFFLLMSFACNAFALQSSTEPEVNFNGVRIGITKTCLSSNGQTLRTIQPIKLYAVDERGGRSTSVFVGSKRLETSIQYETRGKCLRKIPKTGSCLKRETPVSRTYELDGMFEVYEYQLIAGKIRHKTSSKIVNYSVEYCD